MKEGQAPLVTAWNVRSQAMILFFEGIDRYNYQQATREKRKQYELDGWKLHIDENFSNFRVTASGRYQVTLIRHINGGKDVV